MRQYFCEVNVGGDVLTTVDKENVSAAEILVLRAIHGSDNVKNIRKGHMDKRSHAEERLRLQGIYGTARVKIDENTKAPVLLALFGPAGAGGKLPLELDGDFPFATGIDDAVEEPKASGKGNKAVA